MSGKEKKPNPFLLRPEEAGEDSNMTDMEDQGTDLESPLVGYDSKEASLAEIAEADMTHVHALKTKADMIVYETEKHVIPEAEGVRDVCDALDAAMESDSAFDFFKLGNVRNYVKSLMVTLQNKPEFSGILLDRDVANIVQFARQAHLQAIAAANMESEAKANRAKKKGSGGSSSGGGKGKSKGGNKFANLSLDGI